MKIFETPLRYDSWVHLKLVATTTCFVEAELWTATPEMCTANLPRRRRRSFLSFGNAAKENVASKCATYTSCPETTEPVALARTLVFFFYFRVSVDLRPNMEMQACARLSEALTYSRRCCKWRLHALPSKSRHVSLQAHVLGIIVGRQWTFFIVAGDKLRLYAPCCSNILDLLKWEAWNEQKKMFTWRRK